MNHGLVKKGTLWHRLYQNRETITRRVISVSMKREFQAMVHNRAYPQANGQVERTNKTIAQMLSKRCYTNQQTWSKVLIKIIYEYNCSNIELQDGHHAI
jgi:hypothetical protein